MSAAEFAVTIGFDALRIATRQKPKNHDLETIIRWLRHVSGAAPIGTGNGEANGS